MLSALRVLAMALATITLTGCAARLPTYPPIADDAALLIIADRLDSVATISASADLTLTAPDGRTVRLDGAFVATPPTRARLRAWKFASPVLDLTALPEGVWVYAPDPRGGQSPPRDVSRTPAASIAPALELLSGGYFRRARPLPDGSTSETLIVVGTALGHDGVRCEIDRRTLTPRRFRFGSSPTQDELVLGHYTMVGACAWPRSILFRGSDGEILVRLNDVELNADLPPAAFTPPARAQPLP
jgi:outer membrane lipoprotein-sorting protein